MNYFCGPAWRYLGAGTVVLGLACLFGVSISASPVVPGYERLRESGKVSDILLGEVLLGELNCISCHTAADAVKQRVFTKPAPDLSEVGARVTPQYLREFILDPISTKPGTTMPGVLHSSAPMAKTLATEALVHYLASLGGPMPDPRLGGTNDLVEQGRILFHSVGCVACHAPMEGEGDFAYAVPLGMLARKTSVDALIAFLLDPLSLRHGGRMPDMRLSKKEARALAVYLLRDQLNHPAPDQSKGPREPGLNWKYYEFDNLGGAESLKDRIPVAEGASETFTLDISHPRRNERFGLVFEGMLEVPEDGEYRFAVNSDDGSVLSIDGEIIVDNDGDHGATVKRGTARLGKGMHGISLSYYNSGGPHVLEVYWNGPGIEGRRPVLAGEHLWRDGGLPMRPIGGEDFVLDPAKVAMGKQMFDALRCASCHALPDRKPMVPAKPLAALNLESAEGCLGDRIRKGVPDYGLDGNQLKFIKAALGDQTRLSRPPTAEERLTHSMASLNCFACHDRGEIGGVLTDRKSHFKTNTEIDLGDEGRFPPTLNRVGYKLKPEALSGILVGDRFHVRYYMTTRMPGFGEKNRERMAADLIAIDTAGKTLHVPDYSQDSWKMGHQLVGVKGLACITCHGILGQKGLGIPGIDLATVYDRVQPAWFVDFLQNPGAFNKDTRMPMFWPGGISPFPDLADGSAVKQMEGIWNYLSLKNTMPLPAGVVREGVVASELVPVEEPIVHRTFMKDVGPRTILAGYPEKVHVAFDANQVRLAKAWRGRFFDASGVASGRTDAFLNPLGEDVVDMPEGPSFLILDEPMAPWVFPADFKARNVGGLEFEGYVLDERRMPTFKYRLNGVRIEEKPVPKVQPGGASLSRGFTIRAKESIQGIYFLAARGVITASKDASTFTIDGVLRISLDGEDLGQPFLRGEGVESELRIPVDLSDGEAEFKIVLDW